MRFDMFNNVVSLCREKGVYTIRDFAKASKLTLSQARWLLQNHRIEWRAVRHSIAYLDLLEGGWWEGSYQLDTKEPLKKYHGRFCSAWGVMLKLEKKTHLGCTFYRYKEIGHYKSPYIRVYLGKGHNSTSEPLQDIVAKCFLGLRSDQKVVFKSKNTWDCHIYNLKVVDKDCAAGANVNKPPSKKYCKQCRQDIVSGYTHYVRKNITFCCENCADIYDEDLKFVSVTLKSGDY